VFEKGEAAMPKFVPGQVVMIRCDIQPGAFPTEVLVNFETAEGPVSGFVRSNNVERTGEDEGFIRATVQEVSAHTITVVVDGSFFTTTGLAYLNRDWANSHVRAAHA
jgi:hypothetical protein